MPIVARSRSSVNRANAPHGRILHLPDALVQHASNDVVLYCRTSELTQKYNGSLDRQRNAALQAIRQLGVRLCGLVYGQEYGQMSADRQYLRRAIGLARKQNAILVAADLSRLIRAEAFDRRQNWHAAPTPEEIARLFELAAGVPFLATIQRPDMTPVEMHSLATKRGKPGRRSTVDVRLFHEIVQEHQAGKSLRGIAAALGIGVSVVRNVLDQEMPGANGLRVRDIR